jgi:hypothetical protein
VVVAAVSAEQREPDLSQLSQTRWLRSQTYKARHKQGGRYTKRTESNADLSQPNRPNHHLSQT